MTLILLVCKGGINKNAMHRLNWFVARHRGLKLVNKSIRSRSFLVHVPRRFFLNMSYMAGYRCGHPLLELNTFGEIDLLQGFESKRGRRGERADAATEL